MSTVADNDLKELKDLINSKFEQINEKIDNRYQLLDSKLNDMRVDIATLQQGQNSLNKRLDETKDSLNKRLDETKDSLNKRLDETKDSLSKRLDSVETRLNTVTLGVFGIIGVLVTALLTFVGKIAFFPNNF